MSPPPRTRAIRTAPVPGAVPDPSAPSTPGVPGSWPAVSWAARTLRALRAVPGRHWDLVLAGGFLLLMAVERTGAAEELHGGLPLALALSTAVAAPLAVRRTRPLAGYLVGAAALSVEALFVLPSPVSPYADLVGLYSLGLYAPRRRAWLGPFAALLGMAAYFADLGHDYPVIPAGVLFLWLLGWAFGYGTARRAEEREAARWRLRREVVAEERARLARELHDSVGHTLNVVLVQAGAARRLLDRDPERTRELLSGMEHTGRDALDDLDRVLGLLRRGGDGEFGSGEYGDDGEGAAPQPGLADLERLADRLGRAGPRVRVRIDPAARRVPRSLDVSAYRIVQEALTNTVKHAGARTVEVTVRCAGGWLAVEVRDDGRGAPAGYTPGRGLLGVAERVSMLGGRVEHGPIGSGGPGGPLGPGGPGGFRLRAELPVP
ncbi:sensor histidine kinase [Kitasatospora purpeofusca]|uniref:sensor histidine kinase n=1 Tax=Kitasatospora purpeofusca TaxID=67352 RepID=UPI00386C3405|nr:sensor histidine kinase [Kitasatospora purpeofusca]